MRRSRLTSIPLRIVNDEFTGPCACNWFLIRVRHKRRICVMQALQLKTRKSLFLGMTLLASYGFCFASLSSDRPGTRITLDQMRHIYGGVACNGQYLVSQCTAAFNCSGQTCDHTQNWQCTPTLEATSGSIYTCNGTNTSQQTLCLNPPDTQSCNYDKACACVTHMFTSDTCVVQNTNQGSKSTTYGYSFTTACE